MSRLPEIAIPSRKSYASDLSDAEWAMLPHDLPPYTIVYGYVQIMATERNIAAHS